MSVINKMLQDLDRRQAAPAAGGELPAHDVHAVLDARRRERWAVRGIVVVLVAAAVVWMAWVAYQLRFRPLVTDLAYRAAAIRRPVAEQAAPAPAPRPPEPARAASHGAPAAAPPEKPASVPEAPAAATPPAPAANVAPTQAPAVAKPQHAAAAKRQPLTTFKLATSIGSGIGAPETRRRVRRANGPKHAPRAAEAGHASAAAPPVRVEKRARGTSPRGRAEGRFYAAAALLNRGRVSEAENDLITALQLDAGYAPARQALVSLMLDEHRVGEAEALLREGLALDAAQPQFATVLGRILAGRGDYSGALHVLEPAKHAAQGRPEFELLLGTVLQRLSRYAEAAQAYRAALRAAPDAGAAWVGLGISLDSLGRRADALEAYRRAIASGSLRPQLKGYAQRRIAALQ